MKASAKSIVDKRSSKTIKSSGATLKEFSPAWVVDRSKDAPAYSLELIDRIRSGVSKSEWKQLITKIGHSEKELEKVLPTSVSSMQKRSVYGQETSERIYELARLYSLGHDVFDSKEDFREWLMSPSKALRRKRPFDLLDSSFGFQVVQNEIVRIQYNVYS